MLLSQVSKNMLTMRLQDVCEKEVMFVQQYTIPKRP